MADEAPKASALLQSLTDVATDAVDLFQKELKLAKAEVADNIARTLRAGLWMSVAAMFAMLAGLLAIQAGVFGLIAWGMAPYWACLLVAAVLAAVGLVCFLKGRMDAARGLVPARALEQIRQDIKSTKEQLS